MSNWSSFWRRGVVSGATSSVASALALAACSSKENNHASAPFNAISHWLWGDDATYRNRPSLRYTMVGYLIHHASATFWALLYERFLGTVLDRRAPVPIVAVAAATSALACFTDFRLTPQRLTPGFEKRLSRGALVLVYSAFGVGLAAGALLCRARGRD